jgi:hypothetical protein
MLDRIPPETVDAVLDSVVISDVHMSVLEGLSRLLAFREIALTFPDDPKYFPSGKSEVINFVQAKIGHYMSHLSYRGEA